MTNAPRILIACLALLAGCLDQGSDAVDAPGPTPPEPPPATVSGATTANVSATAVDLVGSAALGGALVYEVTVANAGPDPSLNATLQGVFAPVAEQPVTPIFTSATPSVGTCVVTPGAVDCQLGDLAVGASVVVTVTATATDLAGALVSWTVGSDTPDPAAADNVATASTPVSAATPDLAVSHQAPAGAVVVGEPVDFTVRARQLGTVGGGPVTLEWTLDAPDVATVVGWSAPLGSCTTTSATVSCTLAGLAPAGEWQLAVSVAPTAGAPISATAAVMMPGEADVDTANNQATATTLSACGHTDAPAADDTTCDGIDDDCDGTIDEDAADVPTTCGLGVCASTGTATCFAGEMQDSCTPAQASAATDATCDGVDDDCDGAVDEDYVGTLLGCTDSCGAAVISSCQDGVETTCDSAPFDATCDGIDDDCDGLTDEDAGSEPTTCGAGVCASAGTRACVDGAWVDDCTEGLPLAPSDLTCDGIDDDCDGSVDENYVPTASSCGVGACASTGTTSCEAGTVVTVCTAAAPSVSEDTVCNGIDDDCDGSIDEDVPALGPCGTGACAATGAQSCFNGVLTSSCVPGEPLAETDTTCDGIDDDCDGVDDDDVLVAFVDCPTDDCEGGVTCVNGQLSGGTAGTCSDGIDNDADGQTDCDALECSSAVACGGPTAPLWTHRRQWPLITKRQWERHDEFDTITEMATGSGSAPDHFYVADLNGQGDEVAFGSSGLYSNTMSGGFRVSDNARRYDEWFFVSTIWSTFSQQVTDVWRHPDTGGTDQLATMTSEGEGGWMTTLYGYYNDCDAACDCINREIFRGDSGYVFRVNGTKLYPTAAEQAEPVPMETVVPQDAVYVDLEGDKAPEVLVALDAYERFDVDTNASCDVVAHVSKGDWTTFQILSGSVVSSLQLPGENVEMIRGNFDGAFGDDVIIRMKNPNVDRIYYSDGTTTLSSPTTVTDLASGASFIVGDVDADGFDDLVRVGSVDLVMHRGSAQGLAATPTLLAAGANVSKASILRDLDGDGVLELITARSGDIKVYTYEPSTQAMALPPQTMPLGLSAHFLDMTDDGHLLVLSGRVVTVFNNVGGVPIHADALSVSHCGDGVCDDVNGEGCDSCSADCGACSPCCSREGVGCMISDECLAQNPSYDYCNDSCGYCWGSSCPGIAAECGEIACAHPGED